jgi:5-carboxymethyl-2-hydroxymuconate isomerase
MPHAVIEYSANLLNEIKIDALITSVYQGAFSSELFSPADIKVRALGFEHYFSGSHSEGFIHVNCKILSGRTQQQKDDLSKVILSELLLLKLESLSISVEVMDIDRESYNKKIS